MAVLAKHLKPIEDAHDLLGLTYRQISAALHADESTLHRWRSGEAEPSTVYRGRLDALGELISELLDTVTPEGARRWLTTEVPTLGGKRPVDLLADGRIEPLVRLLLQVNLGASL
jgi:ribosome-binding protein aMBF1 (putative translation factor)